ncbi:MAG: guanylate kinase [Bdellovibrionales bacterium]|nr:guanylate kinase [Bdellovibrionales bacterium]
MSQQMLILIGPSGVGKSTFVERTLADYKHFVDTITYTSRPMRKGESEGNPYHFVAPERFEELISEDFFVEWAQVHGRYYGTPHHQILDIWKNGKIVLMDVDVQGAKTFKAKFPQALTLFILPPSLEALRQRVISREGIAPADIEVRMESAQKELAQARDFDLRLINDDFTKAYAEYRKLIEDHLKIK